MNTNIEYWFLTFVAVVFLWNVLVLIASIIYRRHKTTDQIPFDESNLVFNESWVSGSSRKNWFTRIGGAGKCLIVSANEKELYIRPFLPFRFLFIPEFFDLEHRIPMKNIESVVPAADMWSRATTRITFTTSEGASRCFDLYLTDGNKFTALFHEPSVNAG